MSPVLGAMAKPAGRPVAAQVVMVAVLAESVALRATAVMAAPVVADWAPGLVTLTWLVTVQVKLAEPG